jgi:uncharacterized protein (TIGR02996 family)
MSDNTAFLRAIIEHPDDDGPRLVYADWLDEQGQAARAELIRVQCELARLGASEQRPHTREMDAALDRLAGLRRRELELWHKLPTCEAFVPWASGISIDPEVTRFWIGDQDGPLCEVHRGFPDSLTLSAAALLGGPCGRCGGRERGVYAGGGGYKTCPACHGTGRTTGCADALLWRPGQGRPCPATAQPVRRVTLTSWPEWDYIDSDQCIAYLVGPNEDFAVEELPIEDEQPIALGLLQATFLGVTFELPPADFLRATSRYRSRARPATSRATSPYSLSTPHVRRELS